MSKNSAYDAGRPVCPGKLFSSLHPLASKDRQGNYYILYFLYVWPRGYAPAHYHYITFKLVLQFLWSYRDSNPGPLPCKGSALAS